MGLSYLVTIFGLIFLSQANSERALFPLESSELCSNITTQSGIPPQDNVNLSAVYRYHNETKKCHKVGEKGPCGQNMIFYADPTNGDYGDCDCNHELRCHRPLIYWPSEQKCYLAYEQGPCDSTEWLTLDGRSQRPTCEYNPCSRPNNKTEFDDEFSADLPENESTFWFHSHETGDCYKTNTQAYCNFPNEVAVFNGFSQSIKPRCSPIQTQCILPEIPTLFCLAGQKWSVMGYCSTKPKCTKHGGKQHRRPSYHFQNKRGRGHGYRGFGLNNRHFWDNNDERQNESTNNSNENTSTFIPSVPNVHNEIRNNNWNRWDGPNIPYLPRRYHQLLNHHHHQHNNLFHNFSSVGPQWNRNTNLQRTGMRNTGPPRRTNSNYVELDRVDFRNNGDEYDTELAPPISTEKK